MQRDHEHQRSLELGWSWHEADVRRADIAVAAFDIVAQLILCRALFALEARVGQPRTARRSRAFRSTPIKCDHFEASTASSFIPSHPFLSAQCLIEPAGKVITGERPDHEPDKTVCTQMAPSVIE